MTLPYLSQNRVLRLMTFTLLYFAQGVPWGFISVGYVVFLADLGMDNTAVGAALALAYLPWSFKILGGPFLDIATTSRWGRRRPFIIIAEFLMGISLLGLMVLDPRTQLSLIGWVLFAHNTFAALQDVAVDALAVDILQESEQGRANSFMWAGKSLGTAAGGSGGLLLAKAIGWPTLFLTMAIIIWLIMLIPLLTRERPANDSAALLATRVTLRDIKNSFNFSTPIIGILIAFLTPAGYALTSAFTTRMMRVDLGLSEEQIAGVSAMDPIAGVFGALLGGFVADRIGLRLSTGYFMVGIAATLFLFGAFPELWHSYNFLLGWTFANSFIINSYNAATLGLFMLIANPKIGATQFAIFMAGTNFCYSATSYTGGWMADHLGYVNCFIIAGTVQLLTITLLPLCNVDAAITRFRGQSVAESHSGSSLSREKNSK